ncbi:30S ribosomal protein S6 [Candidatus Nomurabacteria bacterium]|nr:30S ribosomal protein S6 [Candidatus Nomurabacteria bacterium]
MLEVENKGQKDQNEAQDTGDKRVYELGYLLVPTIKEEDLSVVYGNLKDLLVSLGGIVITDEMPKMMPLAYSMSKVVTNVRSKFNTAYFGWIKFFMDSSEVLKLKTKLDLDPNFLRFLVLKTVKENTIASKRFVRGDMPYRGGKDFSAKREKEEGVVTEINKEEIDQEIDAMVAV